MGARRPQSCSFPVLDANNKIIGALSLQTDDIPRMLMAGQKFSLSGAYLVGVNQFREFYILPEPAKEKKDG